MCAQLGEEASDKVLEIEQQYSKLRRPMYAQRNELLKGIPSFWQIALLRHRELRNTATEDDEAVLGFCTEVGLHAGPRGAGKGSGRSSARTSWSEHSVCECLYRHWPNLMQATGDLDRGLVTHANPQHTFVAHSCTCTSTKSPGTPGHFPGVICGLAIRCRCRHCYCCFKPSSRHCSAPCLLPC